MITLSNLSFSYGKQPLFENLTLQVEKGNIYGLLGKNGAGKTSLLRIISGLLYPTGGTSTVFGFDPAARAPSMLNRIFSVPEEFLLPPVKAEEFITTRSPLYPEFDLNAFRAYSSEFELDPEKKLSAYSYGQKKKFLLAFGLATNCSLLLLDEPTNGLDIPAKSQFRRTVASALTEERTFIISTHQVRDMENLIDPIIILDEGQIIFSDEMAAVTNRIALTVENQQPTSGTFLYAEKVLGGYMVARENSSGEETAIDLEVLFNLITSGGDTVRSMFEKEAAK